MKKSLSLADVYRLLEPGPVVLLTTAHRGKINVMPMSWHMMMEFEPPLVGCIVSNRNYSFELLRKSGECVINIPTAKLIKQAVACGNCSGLAVDKFSVFGLTPMPASRVKAPLIDQCPVSFECVVADRRMVNRYNLFVLEVVKAWRAPSPRRLDTFHHKGWGEFMLAGKTLKLASRMK